MKAGRGLLLFEPPQRVLCFSERVLNQFEEKEQIFCPRGCQTWLMGGEGTKAVQRIASLNSRGQVDGGKEPSCRPEMKRPVQLLWGKRPIMANPPVNEVDSVAIYNQPGLSCSTDSHFSKISVWSETENRGRWQRGCLKWILLSLLKSDGRPAITQPRWHKSQAVSSCFHRKKEQKSTVLLQSEAIEMSIFTHTFLLRQLISPPIYCQYLENQQVLTASLY